jgi:hypothetical protein
MSAGSPAATIPGAHDAESVGGAADGKQVVGEQQHGQAAAALVLEQDGDELIMGHGVNLGGGLVSISTSAPLARARARRQRWFRRRSMRTDTNA